MTESANSLLPEEEEESRRPLLDLESIRRSIDDGECTLDVHRLVATYLGAGESASVAIQFWCKRLSNVSPADNPEAVFIAEAAGVVVWWAPGLSRQSKQ